MALAGSSISAIAIDKAEARARALGIDLKDLSERLRDAPPVQVSSQHEQEERRRFLLSLYDGSREATDAFERIIAGNELQPANYLSRGALAARAILRVVIRASNGRLMGYGTGFLIGDGVLITNNHVLPGSDVAAASEVEAFFEQGVDGSDMAVQRYALEPQRLFYTSSALDFTVVAVSPTDQSGQAVLSAIGWLPLIGSVGKVLEGEWLTIVQHPKGERKQVCVRENQLLKRDVDVLWYSTDTLAGTSGAPVLNNDWLVVALHHSGVPETKNGRWQTIDGRDFDPERDSEDKVKWKANEGIRVSRIVETLRSDNVIADHPMVRKMLGIEARDISVRLPILFGDGMPPAASLLAAASRVTSAGPQPPSNLAADASAHPGLSGDRNMNERLVTITLAIAEDGSARIVGSGGREADLLAPEKSKPQRLIEAPVEEEKDWGKGFDPKFLDLEGSKPDLWVHLPKLSPGNQALVAPLKRAAVYGRPSPSDGTSKAGILDYWNYSVVINARRRLAFFSAANMDGAARFELARPKDNWLWDDRIDRDHQLGPSFYVGNKFDRGHLTRREDLEWGANPVEATRKANGTCTWANCSPQHEVFNQDQDFAGKTAALWGGLEKYILEQTAEHYQFRVQSITGPIFGADDPVYRDVRIPLSFWKVVVAVDATGKLFATAYVLSQDFLIERDWGRLDEAAVAEPFGKFETYQTKISEIENETGISFTFGPSNEPLSKVDPLTRPVWRRRGRRSGQGPQEAYALGGSSGGPLESFDDLVLF